MAKTTSVQFVQNVARNLDGLTVVTDAPTAAQQDAIQRLRRIITTAQTIVGKLTSGEQFERLEVQTFTMISMANAVFKYAQDIFYAWAYAIALDFAPLLFILLLAIGKIEEQKEITLEEAEKEREEATRVRLNAETAAQTVLDNASATINRTIEQTIAELEPQITLSARDAEEALAQQVTEVVDQIRRQVRDITEQAKRDMESEARDWIQRIRGTQFRIAPPDNR